jgi:hypothetical protein
MKVAGMAVTYRYFLRCFWTPWPGVTYPKSGCQSASHLLLLKYHY